MPLQHPLGRRELRHDRQLQVEAAQRAQIHDQEGPKLDDFESGREGVAFDAGENGNDCSQGCECTAFEFEQGCAVRGRSFGKDADRVVLHTFNFNLSLAFLNLFDDLLPCVRILTSIDEETLEATCSFSQEWHIAYLLFGCETRV